MILLQYILSEEITITGATYFHCQLYMGIKLHETLTIIKKSPWFWWESEPTRGSSVQCVLGCWAAGRGALTWCAELPACWGAAAATPSWAPSHAVTPPGADAAGQVPPVCWGVVTWKRFTVLLIWFQTNRRNVSLNWFTCDFRLLVNWNCSDVQITS